MENKINIAELLKDCPNGMELDCTMFENLEFDSIVTHAHFPIRCRVKHPDGGYNVYNFTKYGCWNNIDFAKCVIFPKGKTNWDGFQRPFKDGDVLAINWYEGNDFWEKIVIFKKYHNEGIEGYGNTFKNGKLAFKEEVPFYSKTWTRCLVPATEEEKQKLFQAIKDNGYKWNAETKTLEKLPKFKVGDRIKHRLTGDVYKVSSLLLNGYGG